jgi:hypothetical protein
MPDYKTGLEGGGQAQLKVIIFIFATIGSLFVIGVEHVK